MVSMGLEDLLFQRNGCFFLAMDATPCNGEDAVPTSVRALGQWAITEEDAIQTARNVLNVAFLSARFVSASALPSNP